MNKILLPVLSILAGTAVAVFAASPQILSVSAPQTLGPSQFRGSIAVDSRNQPHVITTEGTSVHFHDKIDGTWRTETMNSSRFNSSQYGNPRLEIVNDNAWYSGVLWGNTVGIAIIYRQNMATDPTPVASSPGIQSRPSPGNWDAGNLSVDPAFPLTAISSSMAGYYLPVTFTGSGFSIGGRGQLFAGQGGEKNTFWISKAGSVAHPDGSVRAIWHGATGGYPLYPSAYRNSLMSRDVAWAVNAAYPAMGDDGAYVNVMSDNVRPEVGYMVATYAGVVMNIWDGEKMLFPTTNLLVVDPLGGPTARRYAPQLAPALGGGVFVLWTRSGRLMLRHVAANGQMGPETDLGPGAPGAITVDSDGNIHIFYVNNGARYIKVETSDGGGQWITTAQDFDGDGRDDLAVYDPEEGRWHIRKVDGTKLTPDAGVSWGYSGTSPVPGDYSGNGRADLAVYDRNGFWHIRGLGSSFERKSIQWGYRGARSVPGDFNGDGRADLAVYAPATGRWHIRSLDGNRRIVDQAWGFSSAVPVPGDYDGDGKDDLALFDTATGRWFILDPDRFIMDNLQWGWHAAQVLAGDVTGDGQDDLIIYDDQTGRWYMRSVDGSFVRWQFEHGYPGTIAVAGDYNGDGIMDPAVYDPRTGRWFIMTLAGAELEWNRHWGFPGTIPVAGDFIGNGQADLAVYDPTGGRWFITTRDGSQQVQRTGGGPGWIPLAGNYGGDAKDDLALFNTANGRWHIQTAGGTVLANQVSWGYAGVIPVAGDYNRNGKADLAVFDPASAKWYVMGMNGTVIENGTVAGSVGGRPVAGDFNGDGRSDLTTFQNGNWLSVARGRVIAWSVSWGWPGAVPVAGDFNGDGRADLAVFDPDGSRWFIRSLSGAIIADNANWGYPTTIPIAGRFMSASKSDYTVFGTVSKNWYILGGPTPFPQWGFDGGIPIGSSRF